MKCNIMEPMISDLHEWWRKIQKSDGLTQPNKVKICIKKMGENEKVYRLYEIKEVVFVTPLIETTHIIIHI